MVNSLIIHILECLFRLMRFLFLCLIEMRDFFCELPLYFFCTIIGYYSIKKNKFAVLFCRI